MCLFTHRIPSYYDKSKTEGKVGELNGIINKLKKSNKALKSQAYNDKEQIGDLNRKLDKSQKSIDNLVKSYNILQSKIKEQQKKYERECKSLDERIVQWKNEIKELKENAKNIATMQSELEEIKEKHANSYHTYVVEKTKNKKLENENQLKTNGLIKLVDGLIEKNKNNID